VQADVSAMQSDEENRLILLLTGFQHPAHSCPIPLDKPARRDYKRCSKTKKIELWLAILFASFALKLKVHLKYE
jgi:hypothetical protein